MKTRLLSLLAAVLVAGACAEPVGLGPGDPNASACAEDCGSIATGPCLQSVCDEATGRCSIVPVADETPCDDGVFCTVDEVCRAGVCGGGKPNLCGASDCADGACNEAARTCTTLPRPDKTACVLDDGNLCYSSSECRAGTCTGVPIDCTFAAGADDCNVGVCNPATGVCEVAPGNDGGPCRSVCGLHETCLAGVCQGGWQRTHDRPQAAEPTACHTVECDPVEVRMVDKAVPVGGACAYDVVGSGFECTTGLCVAGTSTAECRRVVTVGATCNSAADDCSIGSCNEDGACIPSPAREGTGCDDRNLCTVADTCAGGSCTGTLKSDVEVYFGDDFEGPRKAWSGPEDTNWLVRRPELLGNYTTNHRNPVTDHSPSMGNRYLASQKCRDGDYIETPTIDLSGTDSKVWLTAWRAILFGVFENTFASYANIKVFDGEKWVLVWSIGGAEYRLDEWTWRPIVIDLTPYKNRDFKVRFDMSLPTGGSYEQCWYLDDVLIANQPCAVTDEQLSTSGGP